MVGIDLHGNTGLKKVKGQWCRFIYTVYIYIILIYLHHIFLQDLLADRESQNLFFFHPPFHFCMTSNMDSMKGIHLQSFT